MSAPLLLVSFLYFYLVIWLLSQLFSNRTICPMDEAIRGLGANNLTQTGVLTMVGVFSLL